MGRIRICKSYTFEAAHRLTGHDGPCRNTHGHSYQLEVELRGEPRKESGHPRDGMIMDFSDMDRIVEDRILTIFDHSLILQRAEAETAVTAPRDEKILYFDFQPTCENLVLDFVHRLEKGLPGEAELVRLKLRETGRSWAEWNRTDNS